MYLAAAKLDKKARSNYDKKQIILGLFTKKEKPFELLLSIVSCLTRIRTSTDRTKNCSATITP